MIGRSVPVMVFVARLGIHLNQEFRVMPRPVLVVVLFAVATGAAGGEGCTRHPDLTAERDAIEAADSAWLAAVRARNVEDTLAHWAPDARVIGPNLPAMVGTDAIRRMVTGSFSSPAFSLSWTTDTTIVVPSADVAYSFGTNVFTVPGPGGVKVDTMRGRTIVVWRKVHGKWLAAADVWTPVGR